jgi:hypothetical protein
MEITLEQELGVENELKDKKLKFDSPEAMYDYIRDCGDLYSPVSGEYLFCYNEAGSICYYSVTEEEALELAKKSKQFDEYWGAFLGWGGHICDSAEYEENTSGIDHAMNLCRESFTEVWYDTKDYTDMVFEIERKKSWIESKIGKGIIDGLDKYAYEFYYRAMHDEGLLFADADRWAWLNTLFGYEIPSDTAKKLINWYWENDKDVIQIEATHKGTVKSICEFELNLQVDFSKWPDKTPDAVKFVWE